jgi:hypothetical protein
MYVGHYHSPFVHFLRATFIELPCELWFKVLSYPLPQSAGDPQYADIWKAAATVMATQPFAATSTTGSSTHPADPRALALPYVGVTVVSVPDDLIADLINVNSAWSKDKNPSGTILEPGFQYETCHAFTIVGRHARVYAAASEIPAVLAYEFTNIMMERLGYDISER